MNAESMIPDQKKELTRFYPLNEITLLNQWMYERIAPFVSGNVLEIEPGNGDVSNLLIKSGISVTLSNHSYSHCQSLKKKYESNLHVNEILQINLSHPNFEGRYKELLGSFHTIFSLNLVEHVCDAFAVANAKKLLAPNGHLMLLMPGSVALYGELDQGLNYWFSHNIDRIKKILTKDFKLINTRYFSLVGIVRYFLSGSDARKNKSGAETQTRYNKVVPTFCIEDLAFMQKGLFVITIAQKI